VSGATHVRTAIWRGVKFHGEPRAVIFLGGLDFKEYAYPFEGQPYGLSSRSRSVYSCSSPNHGCMPRQPGVLISVGRIELAAYLVGGMSLHQLGGLMPVVELVGASIGIPALSENEDVAVPAERIGEDGGRAEVDIAVVAWRRDEGQQVIARASWWPWRAYQAPGRCCFRQSSRSGLKLGCQYAGLRARE
jgi:hypothetical protein